MNGYDLQQSSTARPLSFFMVDSTDHVTGKTGLSPTVTICKQGGSFATPAGAVTEIGNGWYQVAANATDTHTLGLLKLHATASGADPFDREFYVVAYNPHDAVRMGMTGIPNATPGASGGVPTVDSNNAVKVQSGTGANQISLSSGKVTPIDVDGITHASAMEILLAVLAGEATLSGNAITFRKRDGTTDKVTVTFDENGNRTLSTIEN
jgi:hypothetical protein